MITSLTLSDFGQHKHLHIRSNGAIVGLLGPNGSGKSTVLSALKFAITGELDDNADTYIRGFDPETKAVVKMEFVKQGMPGTITRTIGKKNTRLLEWDGKTIKSAAEVDSLMGDIWGASSKALLFGIFIRQGELDKLLFGLPSEREALFVKLVGLGHCEGVCSKIDAMINIRKVDMVDHRPLIDQLMQTMNEQKTSLADAEARLAGIPDLTGVLTLRSVLQTSQRVRSDAASRLEMAKVRAQQSLTAVTETYQRLSVTSSGDIDAHITQTETPLQAARAQVERLTVQQKACGEALEAVIRHRNEVAKLESMVAPTQQDVQTADQTLADLVGLVADIKTLGTAVREQVTASQALVAAENNLEVSKARLDKHAVPVDFDSVIQKLEQERQLTQLSATLIEQRLGAHIHTDACPACGSKTPDPEFCTAEHLLELKSRLQDITQELSERKRAREDFYREQREAELAYGEAVFACNQMRQKLTTARAATNACQWNTTLMGAVCPDCKLVPGAIADVDQATVDALVINYRTIDAYRHSAQQTAAKQHSAYAEYATLRGSVEALRGDAQRRLASLDCDEAEARRRHDSFNEELSGIVRKIEELNSSLNGWRAWKANLVTAERDLANHTQQLAAETEAHQRAGQEVDAALSAIKANKQAAHWLLDPGDRLTDTVDEIQTRIRSRQELVGSITAMRAALQDSSERLAGLEAKQREVDKRSEIVRQLQTLRAIFDRKGLPMMYVRHRFEQLAQLTAANLAAMDSDFSVSVDPNSAVSFLFARTSQHEAPILPQCKLSGGQRVRLGIAFLLAVQQLICPDVGLLCLDEPSMHLDQSGIESLRDLLESMAARLKNADTQIWVADHSPVLETAFTSKVRLEAA